MNLALCYGILDVHLGENGKDYIKSSNHNHAIREIKSIISRLVSDQQARVLAGEILSSAKSTRTVSWIREQNRLPSECDERDYRLTNPAILSTIVAELYIQHLQDDEFADEIRLPSRSNFRMH